MDLMRKYQLKECSVKLERLDYDDTSSNQNRPDLYNVVGHYRRLKVCLVCHKTFNLMSDLKIHMHFTHTNHPTLEETLQYSFMQNTLISKQSREAKNSRKRKQDWLAAGYARPLIYKCEMCGVRFAKPHKLKEHYQSVHLKLKPCRCKFCGERFSTKYILLNHITMTHVAINRYQCPLCPPGSGEKRRTRFSLKSFLVYHIKTHHYDQLMSMAGLSDRGGMIYNDSAPTIELTPNLIVDTRGYECSVCGATFKHQLHYHKHFKSKHRRHPSGLTSRSSLIPRFVCRHCPSGSSEENKEQLSNETEVEDPLSLEDEREMSFQLPVDQEQQVEKAFPIRRPTFSSAKALERHVKAVHMELKSFVCSTCGQAYLTKGGLDFHAKRAHNSMVATRSCPASDCDKSFTSIASLTRHFKTFHSTRGPHFTTNEANDLNGQIRPEGLAGIKVGCKMAKPFECKLCNRAYTVKCALTRHVQINHENRRDYECRLCGSRFPDTFTLNRHLFSKVHADVFTTPCHYCDRRFQNESELASHLEAVNNHAPPKVLDEATGTDPGVFNYYCKICRGGRETVSRKRDGGCQEVRLDDDPCEENGERGNEKVENKDVGFRFYIELELHHQKMHPGEPTVRSYKKFVTPSYKERSEKRKKKEAKMKNEGLTLENEADDNLNPSTEANKDSTDPSKKIKTRRKGTPALCHECGKIVKSAQGLKVHRLFKHGGHLNDDNTQTKCNSEGKKKSQKPLKTG